jgi:hypothetical protein
VKELGREESLGDYPNEVRVDGRVKLPMADPQEATSRDRNGTSYQ